MTDKERQKIAAMELEYPDALLLFREGDFYVAHTEHAIIIALVLQREVALDAEGDAYLQFDYESADVYITRIRKAGHKVVIYETLPQSNKQLIITINDQKL